MKKNNTEKKIGPGRPGRKHTPISKGLADRLTDLVINAKNTQGLSHKQIAHDIGISDGALSQYMSDEKTAGIEAIVKIADYFDVSTDYLLGGEKYEAKLKLIDALIETEYYTGLTKECLQALHDIKNSKSDETISGINSEVLKATTDGRETYISLTHKYISPENCEDYNAKHNDTDNERQQKKFVYSFDDKDIFRYIVREKYTNLVDDLKNESDKEFDPENVIIKHFATKAKK